MPRSLPSRYLLLAFLLLPATLASAERLVLDGPLCALFAGYMKYAKLGRWKAMYAIATIAPLVRETGILILARVYSWQRCLRSAGSSSPSSPRPHSDAGVDAVRGAAHTLDWGYSYFRKARGRSVSAALYGHPQLSRVRRLAVRLYETIDFLAMAGYILCLTLAAKWLWAYRTNGRMASS